MLQNKLLLSSKLIDASTKDMKVEIVRRANKEAKKEAKQAFEVAKKAQAVSAPRKSVDSWRGKMRRLPMLL